MRKIILILFISLIPNQIINASPIKSPLDKLFKHFKNGQMIKINSYNAKNYMEIKDGTYKKSPLEIEAFIAYPKKGEGPFPLVMFAHASGGPLLFTDKWFKFNRLAAKTLQSKGIAVMFIDNFAPRGTYTTYANQQKVPHWSTFIDTFMALEHVSKDPKININKVGITGWSRGGAISIMASEKKLRDALIDKNLFFAAAQPRSPPCWSIGMFNNPTPIPETKTWMVLGGADNYTAAEPCVELGKKIKANGGNIEVTVKKGWHHGFTANYKEEWEKDGMVFTNCPGFFTNDDGTSSSTDPNYKWAKSWWMDSCIKNGAHIGGDKGKVFKSKFVKFFKKELLN